MNSAHSSRVLSLDEAATYRPQQIVELSVELAAAKHQLDWFKRQIFGQKSERRLLDGQDAQLSLGVFGDPEPATPVVPERVIAAHTRRSAKPADSEESLSFFDATRVPVQVIDLPAPEAQGLSPNEFEVIGQKDSYRLAQRPASLVVLHFRRPVIKLKASQAIVCASAPVGVIEGSRADVSFLAGLLIDKFAYHCVLRMRPLQSGRKQCCTKDEGRPLEVGLQEQASNHHKLRRLRVSVVSVAGKGGARLRQVGFKETNASEPPMTCRYEQSDVKTGRGGRPEIKLGGTCLLPNWHPA